MRSCDFFKGLEKSTYYFKEKKFQTCRVNSNLTFARCDLSSLHEACIFLQSQSTDEFETCQRKLATVAPLRLLLTSLVL